MEKKKKLIIIILFLAIAIAFLIYSQQKEAKDEKDNKDVKEFTGVKLKIQHLNKMAENSTHHAVYELKTSNSNKTSQVEMWQNAKKLRSESTTNSSGTILTSISLINELGVFSCIKKGSEETKCLKPKELQDKYSARTTQAFRDEILEKLNVTELENREIAGEDSQCFSARIGEQMQEACYSNKGVMVYLRQNLKEKGDVELTAKSIDYQVDNMKFNIPGTVLVR